MKRFFTFVLDSVYDLFGLLFIFIVLAAMVLILWWRLNILFAI